MPLVRPRAEVLSTVGLMARADDSSQTWVSNRCDLTAMSYTCKSVFATCFLLDLLVTFYLYLLVHFVYFLEALIGPFISSFTFDMHFTCICLGKTFFLFNWSFS